MPPAKKAAAKATSSRVSVGAEDEVVNDSTPPAEAEDPALSSRAKDELFGDAPKSKEGVRPEGSNENVQPLKVEDATADKPVDATVAEAPDLSPPERHEHSAHESADAVEDDADYDAEEVEAKP